MEMHTRESLRAIHGIETPTQRSPNSLSRRVIRWLGKVLKAPVSLRPTTRRRTDTHDKA